MPGTLAAIGATMPAAVVMATVAEPVAIRIITATSQPSTSTDTWALVATSTMDVEMPESRRMRPKPPPAPTTSVMMAVGATHSLVNFRIVSRLKPRALPKV
ncbi:hypothetical protein D3C72_1140970 [compost metagenome]